VFVWGKYTQFFFMVLVLSDINMLGFIKGYLNSLGGKEELV